MGTPVPCPACRYPNLGIDIWCERCGTPLEWNGQKVDAALPLASAQSPPSPARASGREPLPVVAPEPPNPPAVHPIASSRRQARKTPTFTLPRVAMPAIVWPRISMPSLTVPRLRVPRVPRIVLVILAVLAVLLIVPLAYMLLPAGRAAVERQSASRLLPGTNGAADETPQTAAIPGVEAKTGLHYRSGTCPTGAACLTLASQTLGKDAAAVVFSTASSAGRQCVGYVYRSGGRWHFLSAVCGLPDQLSPLIGHDAIVHVPGNCANVRDGASLKAHVVACLNAGTSVHIDGGPSYADSRLWWHENQGWIAQDFLTGR